MMSGIDGVLQSAVRATKAGPALKKLKETGEKVESMFLKDMLAEMRKTAQHKPFGENMGGEMFQGMMDQTIAESMGKTESLGLSKMIYNNLARTTISSAMRSDETSKTTSKGTKQP